MIKIIERTPDGIARWIHVENPGEAEISDLSSEYNTPRDYFSSALDPFENARTEKIQYLEEELPTLIVLQYVHPIENSKGFFEFNTRPISIILTEYTLITVSKETPDFLTQVYNDFKDNEELALDNQAFALEVFWQIKIRYIETLRYISEEIEHMQDDIEKSSKNEELYRLIAAEKSLVYLETAIQNNREVLKDLEATEHYTSSERRRALLHDVLIESYQAENMVTELLNLATHLSNTFSSVVSNNLNNIMKVLTSITIILTIPTIISGIWGMNITLPWMSNSLAFWILLGITLLVSVVVVYWLRKQDYL